MNQFTFILNPEAGKGSAERTWRRLEPLLAGSGIRYDLLRTTSEGDAVQLARNASGQCVVAVGGDGTVNEIANALAGSEKTLGVIPAGSGNDMIKSIGVPVETEAAFEVLLSGKKIVMDVGTVRCSGGDEMLPAAGESEVRCFVNGVGVGFDAAVAVRTRQIRFLSGTALYLLAALQTLGKYDSPFYDVAFDGKRRRSRNLLMAIGNGVCAGGGFYLTPDARVDDGLLDLCVIERASVARILLLMPSAMRGKHGPAKEVNFYKAKEITISSETPFYVHADGEIVGRQVRSVELGIVPSSLTACGTLKQ
jgi:YegS/Rv2252/BmrU family lipid kinase